MIWNTEMRFRSKKAQYSVSGLLLLCASAALVFSQLRPEKTVPARDRFLFSRKASAVVAWTQDGAPCPDGVSDGNDLVVEVFYTPMIERIRVPTDGAHFVTLLICLPEDSSEKTTHVLSLPASSTSPQLQRGEYSAVYFAHPRCLYPDLHRTQSCKVTLNNVSETSMTIHIDAKLEFFHLGELVINRTFQFRKGVYGDVPMAIRAGLR